jgi:hypothetical protein
MKHVHFLCATVLAACSSGTLTVSPNPVEFGEIDFNQDKPDSGYNVQEIFLQNEGETALELTIYNVDDTRVLLTGQFLTTNPLTLMSIEPGQYHTLNLGIMGYNVEAGERDTLVEGSIMIDAPNLKEAEALSWSFTPIRVFDDGSDD